MQAHFHAHAKDALQGEGRGIKEAAPTPHTEEAEEEVEDWRVTRVTRKDGKAPREAINGARISRAAKRGVSLSVFDSRRDCYVCWLRTAPSYLPPSNSVPPPAAVSEHYTSVFVSWCVGGGVSSKWYISRISRRSQSCRWESAWSRLYRAVRAIMRLLAAHTKNNAKYREVFHFDESPPLRAKKENPMYTRADLNVRPYPCIKAFSLLFRHCLLSKKS